MDLNADFTQRAVVHAAQLDWVASPMAGVDRRMLDRIGGEVARATSIVRYAPGSKFSAHTHTGGEEFLVLEGIFQDEHGDFPTGTYVRNPPTTSHTPGSDEGCTIFVKLWQFDMDDRTQFRVDTNGGDYMAAGNGVSRLALHRDDHEDVCVETWEANAIIPLDASERMEILTLKGSFAEGEDNFAAQSWLRLPKGSSSTAVAGPEGAKVWIKRNHLSRNPQPPQT